MNKKSYVSPACRVILIETAMPLADTQIGVGGDNVDTGIRSTHRQDYDEDWLDETDDEE